MSDAPKEERLTQLPEVDRRTLLKLLGPAALASTAGCLGGGDDADPGDDGTADGTDDTGDVDVGDVETGGTLNVGMSVGIQSLDGRNVTGTQSMQVAYNIYSRLLEYRPGPDGEPRLVGDLAQDWEQVDDTTLVMDLHEDAVFHNGNPVQAADVVHTFETMFEEVEFTASTLFARQVEVEEIDEHTVEFDTGTEPFASLESTLGFIIGIVDRRADEEGDMALEPVGSGPFEFEEWVDGDHVYVNRFDDYWKTDEEDRQLPYLDRIEFDIFPDENTKFREFETGNLDWIDVIPPRDVEDVRADDNLVAESPGAGGVVQVVSFNTTEEPFSDPNYRKAVLHALDWDAINQVVYQGLAERSPNQILPPQTGWVLDEFEDPYQGVDIDRAQNLIAESDIDPADVEFTNTVPRGDQQRQQVQEIIQETLSNELGIEYEIERADRSVVFERTSGNEFGIAISGIQGMWDPDQLLSVIFNPAPAGFFNYGDFENDEIIDLLGQGRSTLGESERRDIYRQLYEINNEQAGKYFPLWLEFVVGHQPEVRNYQQLHDQFWLFDDTWME